MNTAKRFTNFSDQDFSCSWNKEIYTVKAKETILLPGYLADHLAKHLIDRELTKEGVPTDRIPAREEKMQLCLGEVEIKTTSEEKLEVEMLNKQEDEAPKNEAPKKEKKWGKNKKNKEEDQFEG